MEMTLDKLYELVEAEYLKHLNDIITLTRKASFPDGRNELTTYEQLIVKEVCKIILTNFTLTDLNARH